MDLDIDISFNINDQITFKPTELAIDLWANYWSKFGHVGEQDYKDGWRKEMEKKDGYVSCQMWQAMAVFGPTMSNGGPQVFVDNKITLTRYTALLKLKS